MHREANLTMVWTGQMSTYDNLFSNFSRSPVPNDLCIDSAPRHPRFWKRRLLKGFYHIWAWGPFGQWTATILAIFHSPDLRRLNMKFEQIWLNGFREVLWNSQQFSYSNVWGSYKCIGKQTWPCSKKVKCQRKRILLATLVDLSSLMICAKIQPPRCSGFWRSRFLKVFTIYGHGSHLGQWTATILAIFCFSTLRWLHMKLEQNWLRCFRGEFVWNSQQFSHSNVWGSYKCIGKRTWPCGKKVKRQPTTILLATLVDLPSRMIHAKIQPQGILSSGEEDF